MKASALSGIAVMAVVIITLQSAFSQQAGLSANGETKYISGYGILRNPYRYLPNDYDSKYATFPWLKTEWGNETLVSVTNNIHHFDSAMAVSNSILIVSNENSRLAFYDDSKIDSIRNTCLTNNKLNYPRKKPVTAFALAFFPGFFVHGLGHYYIGENKTGSILLASEVISVSYIYFYTINGGGGHLENTSSNNSMLGQSFVLLSAITFFGTWIYDFSAAPNKTIKLNKEHGMSLRISPNLNKNEMSIHASLKF